MDIKTYPAILMGHPAHFRIRGGANPHTRTSWGFRKSVDRVRAAEQWRRLADLLTDLGVRVFVLPARPESPGMVFPANAGFLAGARDAAPASRKKFHISLPIPSRAREGEVYGEFLRGLGFGVEPFPLRFEGEADFFEAGSSFLFTSGPLERQRFVPRLGWPPYRRVYGFRSDPGAVEALRPLAGGKPVLPLALVRETHYHGDTCLCSFGRGREFLMAYPPALSSSSRARLKETFGGNLMELSEEDGERFSANSFQVDGPEPVLVMPATATPALKDAVRERGVRVETADVSEFMSKGGGSVKCMVGDLGLWPADETVSAAAQAFREERLYRKGDGR
ncbi:MAG: dimethylarginine dimethylaminohydrolase family protein [Elusimicrobiota bacterium]